MTVRRSGITINVGENGSLDINIENLHPSYMPDIIGNLIKEIIKNPFYNPVNEHERKLQRVSMLDMMSNIIEENTSQSWWRSLREEQPATQGPFWCIEKDRPQTVYTNMYWDDEQKMFGTKDGDGYAFITHWMLPPLFVDEQEGV